ncbi:hypothetical protein, variant [Thecamonas trahens ATCC 50062]|uniref:TIR domain-containing protein n=1 Tax=Thecamonas trahens ATCC 50062 TaxID=461836 RepID=A0A0L0DQR3_THETB|nr:hypothetical protein, variant [Thecamonas trahens ATCC 50062]KNC54366.1 hypothetical protein, variant [Thecamonas trahens ATCC 50062]|eukprot:XP_013753735.1 hypothetical protein, variant [Thecamonas trahens ATCC 50062]
MHIEATSSSPAGPSSTKSYDVFLCHGSNDKGLMLSLRDKLVALGLRVFLDVKSLDAMIVQDPADCARLARDSHVVVVVVSKYSIVTRWAIAEADAALADPTCKVFPVFADAELSLETVSSPAWRDGPRDASHPLLAYMAVAFPPQIPNNRRLMELWEHDELTPELKVARIGTLFALLERGLAPRMSYFLKQGLSCTVDTQANLNDLQPILAAKTRALANARTRILLILDDAWDTRQASVFANHIAAPHAVLVTSRNAAFATNIATSIELGTFDTDDAAVVLRNYLAKGSPEWANTLALNDSRIVSLATFCRGHALALAVLGSSISGEAALDAAVEDAADATELAMDEHRDGCGGSDAKYAHIFDIITWTLGGAIPKHVRKVALTIYAMLAVFPSDAPIDVANFRSAIDASNIKFARALDALANTSLLRVVLEGHTDCVNGVLALPSADGQLPVLVSWSEDNTIRVWHAADDGTGAMRYTADTASCEVLKGHTSLVRGVIALPSADGQLPVLVSWSEDKTIRVWHPADDGTGAMWYTADSASCEVLEGHTGDVNGVIALPSADSQLPVLVSWSWGNTIRVWHPADDGTGPMRYTADSAFCEVLEGHANIVEGVIALPSADGQLPVLVSRSGDRTIRVWHPADDGTGPMRYTAHSASCEVLEGHTKYVEGVVTLPSADGQLPVLVSWSRDRTIRVWHPADDGTGAMRYTTDTAFCEVLEGHTDDVRGVIALPSAVGQLPALVSWSRDRTIRVWHAADDGMGTIRYTADSASFEVLEGHTDGLRGLIALPSADGQLPVLVSWSRDRTIRVWHPADDGMGAMRYTADSAFFEVLKGHTRNVQSVIALPMPASKA